MDLDLTKADVAKLSAEQQETIARIALDRGRMERETLERAAGYPGQGWVPVVLFGLSPLVASQISRNTGTPQTMSNVITILFALLFVMIHSQWGSNRRMEAMLRLIKEQAKEVERLKGARAPGVDGE